MIFFLLHMSGKEACQEKYPEVVEDLGDQMRKWQEAMLNSLTVGGLFGLLGAEWKLDWSDEFEADTIKTSKSTTSYVNLKLWYLQPAQADIQDRWLGRRCGVVKSIAFGKWSPGSYGFWIYKPRADTTK